MPEDVRATTAQERKALALFRKLSPHGQHLASVTIQALRRDSPKEIPTGPDGELIWQCHRMIAINNAIGVAYQMIPEDDDARNGAVDPLNDEWFSVQRHSASRLHAPAAEVMLSYVALDSYAEAVESADVLMWLSRACAEYLASEAV